MKRKNIRLKVYDYSQNGAYFVTVCTKERRNILSTVRVGGGILDAPYVELTEFGEIVEHQFEIMNGLYDFINVKHYIIMPNHIHFIIEVVEKTGTSGRPSPTRSNSIVSNYVGTFKRFTNRKSGTELWQRSFYDHIIRNDADYLEKANYILTNPHKWYDDEYYTKDEV